MLPIYTRNYVRFIELKQNKRVDNLLESPHGMHSKSLQHPKYRSLENLLVLIEEIDYRNWFYIL